VRIPRGSPFPLRGGSLSPKASRGFRKRPEGSQKLPRSSPVPAPVAPEAPQRLPRRTQETARAAQRPPRGSQGFPKASQVTRAFPESAFVPPAPARGCPKVLQMLPEGTQTLPKGSPMPSRVEALSLENLAGCPGRENSCFVLSITSSTKRF
jgi:hypothetical protein